MKNKGFYFSIFPLIILLSQCNKPTECNQANQYYHISDHYKDWPFMTRYKFEKNGIYDTIYGRINGGPPHPCLRMMSKSSTFDYSGCPNYTWETLELEYGGADLYFPVPFDFDFETNTFLSPNGSLWIKPLQSRVLYDLKTLTNVTPQNDIKNGVLLDSVVSFGKTYYKVWDLTVSTPTDTVGTKYIYFSPQYGLIKYEQMDGTIVEIQN